MRSHHRLVSLTTAVLVLGMILFPFQVMAVYKPPNTLLFSCSGKVAYDNGVPAEGAVVELYTKAPKEPEKYEKSVTVDDEGQYYLSIAIDSRDPFALMPHFIIKVRYYFNGGQEAHFYEFGRHVQDFNMGIDEELRIASFFYDVDDRTDWVHSFGDQLKYEEGFDHILYFMGIQDWQSQLQYIDTIETPNDHVFFFFVGHGSYHNATGTIGISYSQVWLDPDASDANLKSYQLGNSLDEMDSDSLIVMVESCFSGGFIEDCRGPNRFIMTSTDKSTYSMPDFPGSWFYYIRYMNEINAFFESREYINQVWGDEMNPQYDYQLPDHWFEGW